MKIQWNYQEDLPKGSYTLIEEYWEDSNEWCIIDINDSKIKTWISLKYPECILD